MEKQVQACYKQYVDNLESYSIIKEIDVKAKVVFLPEC